MIPASKSAWVACLSAVIAASCSGYDPDSQVIVQVCLPAAGDDGRQGLEMNEIAAHSIGGASYLQTGITAANQRVIETFLSSPGDSRYVVIGARDSRKAVVVVPRKFARGEWTAWRAVDFTSAEFQLEFVLLHDQELTDRTMPPANAPQVRFQVMPFNSYLERVKTRREHGLDRDIPAC